MIIYVNRNSNVFEKYEIIAEQLSKGQFLVNAMTSETDETLLLFDNKDNYSDLLNKYIASINIENLKITNNELIVNNTSKQAILINIIHNLNYMPLKQTKINNEFYNNNINSIWDRFSKRYGKKIILKIGFFYYLQKNNIDYNILYTSFKKFELLFNMQNYNNYTNDKPPKISAIDIIKSIRFLSELEVIKPIQKDKKEHIKKYLHMILIKLEKVNFDVDPKILEQDYNPINLKIIPYKSTLSSFQDDPGYLIISIAGLPFTKVKPQFRMSPQLNFVISAIDHYNLYDQLMIELQRNILEHT